MIIAVDFDGTIVENRFPDIGRERPFAVQTLRMLSEQHHHRIVLWTVRCGQCLQEAIDWCEQRGLHFYAVNNNYPEEQPQDGQPRKLNADLFIDDRNVGGLPDWGIIYRMITEEKSYAEYLREAEQSEVAPPARGHRLRLFSRGSGK